MHKFLNHMKSTLENVLKEPSPHLDKQMMPLHRTTILPI